jgi:hypothetical protein
MFRGAGVPRCWGSGVPKFPGFRGSEVRAGFSPGDAVFHVEHGLGSAVPKFRSSEVPRSRSSEVPWALELASSCAGSEANSNSGFYCAFSSANTRLVKVGSPSNQTIRLFRAKHGAFRRSASGWSRQTTAIDCVPRTPKKPDDPQAASVGCRRRPEGRPGGFREERCSTWNDLQDRRS